MSGGPSFKRIDYSIRWNKKIERKAIFERIQRSEIVSSNSHRYVGLGSIWFSDFVIAHRMFSLEDMVSFEYPENCSRAEANVPYACIKLIPGDCNDKLIEMDAAWWSKPLLIWLDYDGIAENEVLKTLEEILQRSLKGSILIVTVNAVRDSYRPNIDATKKRACETLNELFGDSAQQTVGEEDFTVAAFPGALSQSMLNRMSEVLRLSARGISNDQLSFLPLFKFAHKDNAQMITVGGAIVDGELKSTSLKKLKWESAEIEQQPALETINIEPLTLREKIALDKLMPHVVGPADLIRKARDAKLQLDAEQLNAYSRYYRHFPIFAEMWV